MLVTSSVPILIALLIFNIFFHLQSWDAYFRSNTYCAPPSLAPTQRNHIPISQLAPFLGGGGGAVSTVEPDEKTIDDHLAVQAIIRSYQVRPIRHNR